MLYQENLEQQFNFDNMPTKVSYAKAKFIVTVAFAADYWLVSVLFVSRSSTGHLGKSFFLFLLIVVLQLARDKYEKSPSSQSSAA